MDSRRIFVKQEQYYKLGRIQLIRVAPRADLQRQQMLRQSLAKMTTFCLDVIAYISVQINKLSGIR
jgi:hypothetical protein